MRSADDYTGISELTIVDTFTRLIFGEESGFQPRDRLIIRAFRDVDANVFMDSPAEMGEYLRGLGVREMIYLVSRIREQLDSEALAVRAHAGERATRHNTDTG